MRIAVDIMGGDNAPQEMLNGALDAARANEDTEIILVGNEDAFPPVAMLPCNVKTVASKTVMAMDEPVENLSRKRDSSIYVATKLVKDGEADAVVSAGSTGAQLMSAILLLGRIPGVKRPPIITQFPTVKGVKFMADAGANPEVNADNLVDFAVLGHCYAKYVLDIGAPKIGLLSNGTESHKGTSAVVEAHERLKNNPDLNFIGNIEGRGLMDGEYDILVTDGFSGNVALKTAEGVAMTIMKLLKQEMTSSPVSKVGALFLKKGLYALKDRLDYSGYGGAPLLGVKGISIISHGGSDRYAFANAIKVAQSCYEADFVNKMNESMAKLNAQDTEGK